MTPGPQRVLVVTADGALAEALAGALRAAGLEPAPCASGGAALRALGRGGVAAMVIDGQLPVMTGFELARTARDHHRGEPPEVVLLTEVAWPPARRSAMLAFLGLREIFTKPVDPGRVAAMVQRSLAGRAVPRPAVRPAAPEPAIAARGHAEPAPTGGAVSGSLSACPFPRLLPALARGRHTGVLQLSGDGGRKQVWLRDGNPVWALSNREDESLGAALLAEGQISAGQRREALARARAERRPEAGVLLELGISRRALAAGLHAQLRLKLLDLCGWSEGDYRLDPAGPPPERELALEGSLADLVLEGVRRSFTPDRLRAALAPHLDRAVRPHPDPARRFQELTLAADEQALWDAVRLEGSLRELLARARLPEARALALVYVLLALEMAEIQP